MSSKPKQKKGRYATLSTLDGVIQILGVAKDACGVPPAQIALGSACVLLTTIKVCSLLLLGGGLQVRVCLGYNGQQGRLCRSWIVLRRGVQSARPGIARNGIRGTQQDRTVGAIDRLKP